MSSRNIRSNLPVPEINEQILNHSSKLFYRKNDSLRVKPPRAPKLKARHHELGGVNRSNISQPLSISFRDSNCDEDLIVYDKSSTISYFEQCFETLSKLGEGSFGEVFKVRSREDGHLYAVKKSKEFFRSGSNRDERLEEVKRYEQFSDHEHCVTLYKAWEQDDRLYMQMELCESSLEEYLVMKKTLPESKIWSILLDMLTALKSLHDRNLIHLDIKLDNILVGDDGKCKLGDFGLVIDVDRANLYQATEGDSRYIAPELMLGNFSKAADIFSLGIAILELSCNLELPPNGLLWQNLRSGNLPEEFINQISVDLQKIIKKMMSPNPLHRPTVTELLYNKRLLLIHQSRQRWQTFKKIKTTIRNTKKIIWAKMCTLKMIIYRLFYYIFTSFKSKQPTNHLDQSDSSNENYLDFSQIDVSSDRKFGDISVQIVNSTPLNHFPSSRLRKNLTNNSCWSNDSQNSFHSDSFILRRTNYSNNVPETVVKKLFAKPEDSD